MESTQNQGSNDFFAAMENENVAKQNKFTKGSLLPNESIVASAEWHWMKYLFPAMMLLILSIALLIGSYYEGKNVKEKSLVALQKGIDQFRTLGLIEDAHKLESVAQWENERSPWSFWSETTTGVLFILCLIFVPISFLIYKMLCKFDEFAITNLRVIAKVGVIRRIAFELRNEQVESIGIYQGILGRIFGYGTLVPGGVGASKVLIRFVKDPFELRQHFFDLKRPENRNTEN